MKINEEYTIAETWDDLISLDRKHGGTLSGDRRKRIDRVLETIENNAPLKLRKWMRQSKDEQFKHPRSTRKN